MATKKLTKRKPAAENISATKPPSDNPPLLRLLTEAQFRQLIDAHNQVEALHAVMIEMNDGKIDGLFVAALLKPIDHILGSTIHEEYPERLNWARQDAGLPLLEVDDED